MLSLFLLLALSGDAHRGGRPIVGGFCVGEAWVQLRAEEQAALYPGVDTTGYDIWTKDGRRWGAGSFANGFTPTPEGYGIGPVAFRRGDLIVRRVRYFGDGGLERGYVVARSRRLRTGESVFFFDNHTAVFTGPSFSGTNRDRTFFDRVEIGSAADRKCAAFWKRMND